MYYQYSPVTQDRHIVHTGKDFFRTFTTGGKSQISYQLSTLFCVAGVASLMTVLFLYISTVMIPSDESIMNSNQNNYSKAENIKNNQKRREDNNKLYLPFGIAGGIATLISVFIYYCFRDNS